MTFDISVLKNSEWVSLNNYVIESDKIPYIERNRNFEPRLNSVNVTLSQRCPIELNVGDVFLITYYNTVIYEGEPQLRTIRVFSGYSSRIYNKSEKLTKSVIIENFLKKLEVTDLNYEGLYSLISDTTDPAKYRYPDNELTAIGLGNVQLIWLLQKMFQLVSLTVDLEEIKNLFIGKFTFGGVEYDYYLKDFCVDVRELWWINQQSIGGINSNINPSLYLKLFDYIKVICSAFSLAIMCTGDRSFAIKPAPIQKYTLTDSEIISYDSEDIEATEQDYNFSFYYSIPFDSGNQNTAFPRWAYYDSQVRGLTLREEVKGRGSTIQWYNSLVLHFRNKSAGAQPGDVVLQSHLSPKNYMLTNYKRAIINSYKNEEIEISTPLDSIAIFGFKAVVQHHLDIQNLTSHIIQETYT